MPTLVYGDQAFVKRNANVLIDMDPEFCGKSQTEVYDDLVHAENFNSTLKPRTQKV